MVPDDVEVRLAWKMAREHVRVEGFGLWWGALLLVLLLLIRAAVEIGRALVFVWGAMLDSIGSVARARQEGRANIRSSSGRPGHASRVMRTDGACCCG